MPGSGQGSNCSVKLERQHRPGAGSKEEVASCCHWWWSCCCCHCSGSFYVDNVVASTTTTGIHDLSKRSEMTGEPYLPTYCANHRDTEVLLRNTCNHVTEKEFVAKDQKPFQDNLGYRSHHDEYDSEFEREADRDSYHERTSGSYTDSYDDGSVQGYRIPYRLMRDGSPPAQPTHPAPGPPPNYRTYPRTILVETSHARQSYVSTICVQPQKWGGRRSSQEWNKGGLCQ